MRIPNDCIVKGRNPRRTVITVWLITVTCTLKIEYPFVKYFPPCRTERNSVCSGTP